MNGPATEVALGFLGALIMREINGQRVRAVVVETEAYQGMEDKACHASRGKTKRNAVMLAARTRYVYFTCRMHWMLNVVCDDMDQPAAVVIRALAPLDGLEAMRARPERDFSKPGWLNGAPSCVGLCGNEWGAERRGCL